MQIIYGLFGGTLGLVWMLAGPITYIICVIDTWSGHASIVVKLLISLTVDVFLSFIWPITWMLWIVMYFAGNETPLNTVLGF